MNVLALELSTARGSVAEIDDSSEVLHEFANNRKHSGEFFRILEQRCHPNNPERIVIGLGPGSYAGVRIAIATAIGLAAASGARLIGFASICALAVPEREYNVIGDARRQSFFFAHVIDGACAEGPSVCSEAELRERLRESPEIPVFSSEQLPAFPQATLAYPSALELARLARRTGGIASDEPLQPIYLREPHITKPRSAALPAAAVE